MTLLLPKPSASRPRTAMMVVLTLLGALWLSAVLARPAAADDAARWTVSTADNSFGAGRPDYGYTLSPGGQLRDGIVVANQGDAPLHLALRPAEGVTLPTGRIGLADRSARPDAITAWVHLARDTVTVAPGASVTVPFTVTPPKGAAAGDHVGGIVTAVAGAAGPAGADQRPGLLIRLRVSGVLKPGLAVESVHVDYSGTANPIGSGDATVSYTIHNSGNAILSARQTLSASGPFGSWTRRAGKIADSPPLLPGATWKVSVPVDGTAPALRLGASVKVVPLLTDAAGSISPLAAVKASGHALAVPWTLVIVLLGVAGLAGLALRRVRAPGRRRVDGAVA